MTKLNQVVLAVKGSKEETNKVTAPLFHSLNRGELFAGLTQHYRPAEEGGATLPDDNTQVQLTVPEVLNRFAKPFSRMLDLIATAETTNTEAFGDVVVDGTTMLEHLPVTFLMQFEKYLEREVRGLIERLPILDPAEKWQESATAREGIWETDEFQTFRQKKVQKPLVLYPASDKHPAQTQMITEDVIDGYWHKRKFSGAITEARKNLLLERLEKLITAVQYAREQANDRAVHEVKVGQAVFDYLLADEF